MSEQEQLPTGDHATEHASSVSQTRRKRLLLIEDEPTTRLVLLNKLRTAGFDVDVAPNGRLALKKLRSSQPDAIFMDLLLPYVKGVEVIKKARRDSGFGDRPIYVCTSAVRMSTWTQRGTKAGATKVFNKATTPIDQIVAEVASDLIGPGLEVDPAKVTSPDTAASDAFRIPTPLNANAGALYKPVVAQENDQPLPTDEPSAQSVPFIKRVMKTLGLFSRPASPSAAPDSPEPIRTASESITPKPGIDLSRHPFGQASTSNCESVNALPASCKVAVLTLDAAGKIVSADDACLTLFGWEASLLVGQSVMVLLKNGLDNELGRFLQRENAGEHNNEKSSFRVIVRKKDGTEFSASVTPLTWRSDTTLTRRSDDSRFLWTAVFRDLSSGAASPQPTIARHQESLTPAAQPPPLTGDLQSLEESQAKLRKTVADLQKQLEVASAEAEKHRAALAETQKERDELERQISSPEVNPHLLRAALQQATEERGRLEHRLQDLTANKVDLEKQLTEERQSQEELLKSSGEFREQLREANAAVEKTEAAYQQETTRARQLEEELTRLRQAESELTGKLATAQNTAAESMRRTEELEGRLRETAGNLEAAKADAGKHSEERGSLETELRAQLDAAKATAEQAQTALKEEGVRNKKFEERLRTLCEDLKREQIERTKRFDDEVTGLRQVSDELQAKLTAEQQATAESARRVEELESRLRDSAAEAERVKAELENQTAEQRRLEAEWREKLSTAEALTTKLKTAWSEAQERNKCFAEELVGLRQVSDKLNTKLAAEQEAAAASKRQVEELESRLRENASELERVKMELEQAAGNKRFEMELASLYHMRDLLGYKLATEQSVSAQSKQRSDELEDRLRQNKAELERVKADADKHAEEQARLQTELLGQLNAARAAAGQAEEALKEKVAQCSQFENELAGLRQVRDELTGKLTAEQQVAAESRRRNEELESRLRENAAELGLIKADAARHAAEQTRLESELRAQLDAAKAAAEQAEAALKEEAVRHTGLEERLRILSNGLREEEAKRSRRYEEELAGLQRARDEVSAKLAAEQQVAAESRRQSNELEKRLQKSTSELESLKARLQESTGQLEAAKAERANQTQEQARRESELQSAKAASDQAKVTLKEKTDQINRLEQEVSNLRKERQDIHARFAAEQQAAAKAKNRCQEFEKQKRDYAADIEKLKSQLESQAEKGRGLERELREELNTVRAGATQVAASLQEAASQRNGLEASLTSLRQERDKLQAELRAAQQASTEARQRQEAMENRLRDTAAELEKARDVSGTQARLESENRTLLEAKEALAAQLCLLREGRAPLETELSESQRQVRESAGSVARITADLEKERGERRRAEQRIVSLTEQQQELHGQLKLHLDSQKVSQHRITELEQRLRQNEDQLAQINGDLQKERTDRQLVEQQLQTGGALSNQLRNCLAAFDEAKKGFKRAQEQMESKVQTSLDALKESESRLQKETAERQRKDEALAAAQRALQEQSQQSATELCQLRAELEEARAESKRLESNAVQSHYASLDSARAGLTMVNRLRTQVREPVDGLMHATRRLLEIELQEEPKKLVEAVLQNALLVQTTLQDAATLNACLPRVETAPPNNDQGGGGA